MESEDEWMHYCDDPRTKQFVFCSIKEIKEIVSRKYTVPYDSQYLYDTVHMKNVIYFAGGGIPALEGSPEQYYKIMMRATINAKFEILIDKMANLNIARAYHSMIAGTKKLLYTVGGVNATGFLSSCEEYDISANKWKEIACLNEKKKMVSLCSFMDKFLYSFGGVVDNSGSASNAIESYDISKSSSKIWDKVKITAGGDLWGFRCFAGAIPMGKDSILVFGGIIKGIKRNDCIEFSPSKKAFTKHSNLLNPDTFCLTKPGMKVNSMLIVGSSGGDLHIYDKTKQKWDLQAKKIWNPEFGFALKSDTF
jgi:hypothetical protein